MPDLTREETLALARQIWNGDWPRSLMTVRHFDALATEVLAQRARVAELEDIIWNMRPTSPGHDCPFCDDWDGETHGEDCILPTCSRNSRSRRFAICKADWTAKEGACE
jgi:hypothetical protein